jgi:peptidoglycan-associated lipoprotein
MRILPKLAVAILPVVLLLNGCGTTGESEQEQGAVAGGGAAAGEEAAASAAKATEAEATPQEEEASKKSPLEEGMLAQRVVYFEFDSSVVHDDSIPLLKAHAQYITSNGSSITLEGHADERGTREYNIALGERRADAVRRILMANGVGANQIKVVSYGEERPAVLGHDESAWSKNRRAELVY